MFGRILVPGDVIRELRAPAAPAEVRAWTDTPPDWVAISDTSAAEPHEMPHLDPGERAAILLAQTYPESLLLIDDAAGRLEAASRGIECTGTLGVLRAAASKKLVDLQSALGRLLETNFRISPSVIAELVAEDAAGRRVE